MRKGHWNLKTLLTRVCLAVFVGGAISQPTDLGAGLRSRVKHAAHKVGDGLETVVGKLSKAVHKAEQGLKQAISKVKSGATKAIHTVGKGVKKGGHFLAKNISKCAGNPDRCVHRIGDHVVFAGKRVGHEVVHAAKVTAHSVKIAEKFAERTAKKGVRKVGNGVKDLNSTLVAKTGLSLVDYLAFVNLPEKGVNVVKGVIKFAKDPKDLRNLRDLGYATAFGSARTGKVVVKTAIKEGTALNKTLIENTGLSLVDYASILPGVAFVPALVKIVKDPGDYHGWVSLGFAYGNAGLFGLSFQQELDATLNGPPENDDYAAALMRFADNPSTETLGRLLLKSENEDARKIGEALLSGTLSKEEEEEARQAGQLWLSVELTEEEKEEARKAGIDLLNDKAVLSLMAELGVEEMGTSSTGRVSKGKKASKPPAGMMVKPLAEAGAEAADAEDITTKPDPGSLDPDGTVFETLYNDTVPLPAEVVEAEKMGLVAMVDAIPDDVKELPSKDDLDAIKKEMNRGLNDLHHHALQVKASSRSNTEQWHASLMYRTALITWARTWGDTAKASAALKVGTHAYDALRKLRKKYKSTKDKTYRALSRQLASNYFRGLAKLTKSWGKVKDDRALLKQVANSELDDLRHQAALMRSNSRRTKEKWHTSTTYHHLLRDWAGTWGDTKKASALNAAQTRYYGALNKLRKQYKNHNDKAYYTRSQKVAEDYFQSLEKLAKSWRVK